MAKLRQCGLNYELHHNGYLEQWPESFWPDIKTAGMIANQYGRTSFLFAGVPGMQMPVSFYKDPSSDSGLSIYEQVYNASIFSLYLPIANVADVKRAFHGRNYTDTEFYHTLLMSNHMESDPAQFADGIRGKVLWHNEYRTQKMYEAFANSSPQVPHQDVRGSLRRPDGAGTFSQQYLRRVPRAQRQRRADQHRGQARSGAPGVHDGRRVQPLPGQGLHLHRANTAHEAGLLRPAAAIRPASMLRATPNPWRFRRTCSRSPPRSVQAEDLYYNNKIMNFYGDSFHVTTPGYSYAWNYEHGESESTGRERCRVSMPNSTRPMSRGRSSWEHFRPVRRVNLSCPPPTTKPWPSNCDDINGAAIRGAIDGGARRVHAPQRQTPRQFERDRSDTQPGHSSVSRRQSEQPRLAQTIAGEIVWNAGSRDGVGGKVQKELPDQQPDRLLYRPIRMAGRSRLARGPGCQCCVRRNEHDDDARDTRSSIPTTRCCSRSGTRIPIAARPTRRVSNRTATRTCPNGISIGWPIMHAGSAIRPAPSSRLPCRRSSRARRSFDRLKCDTCHVIRKIDIVPDDTMLTKDFRDRLATRVAQPASPFLSYIGTDLLMHDMGYLSQVGNASQPIRDSDGVVTAEFQNYVQKIRTPALKGLRFNRFVTDSHKNTKNARRRSSL